jgi:predicted nucleotidyltransferase
MIVQNRISECDEECSEMAQVVHKVRPAVVRERIHATPEEIAAFCRTHHIRWLALFGSVLRDDFRDDSDIDVLVRFDAESRITFFDVQEIEDSLSSLMCGRTVDLVTEKSLHRLIRERVLPSVEVQYGER